MLSKTQYNGPLLRHNEGPTDMKTILSQRLRAARQAMHPSVTQRAVAQRLKLSPSAINLWEHGKTQPSAQDIAELSRWFGVSADWLLGVETNRPGPKVKPPVFTVPVVDSSALLRWHWEAVSEALQTAVLYPPGTAAAILVASDALSSACPSGAYAVISKAHEAQPGCIVLAAVAKASPPILRRYVREAADDYLVADDSRFPTHRLVDGARLLGRVVEVTVRRMV
jgi:transcriptional regulator with XRE-family HTH domain